MGGTGVAKHAATGRLTLLHRSAGRINQEMLQPYCVDPGGLNSE